MPNGTFSTDRISLKLAKLMMHFPGSQEPRNNGGDGVGSKKPIINRCRVFFYIEAEQRGRKTKALLAVDRKGKPVNR